jgi:hypothetical protein
MKPLAAGLTTGGCRVGSEELSIDSIKAIYR